MAKEILKTIRFTPKEGSLVEDYLRQNPIFESFSALARVATLTFMEQEGTVRLSPVRPEEKSKRLRFLWDYDLNENQVREILQTAGLSNQKRWLIERILLQARFDETLCYLTLDDIQKALPQLRLPQKIRSRWEYALKLWSRHDPA